MLKLKLSPSELKVGRPVHAVTYGFVSRRKYHPQKECPNLTKKVDNNLSLCLFIKIFLLQVVESQEHFPIVDKTEIKWVFRVLEMKLCLFKNHL